MLEGHVRVRDFRGERDDWGIGELEAVGRGGYDLAVARVVLQTQITTVRTAPRGAFAGHVRS